MANQAELEKWIRDGLNQGSDPESLKSQLISSGYDTSLVDKVLQENSGSALPDNANTSPPPPNTANFKEGYQSNPANQDSTGPAQNTQDTGTQAPPNNIQQSNTDNEFHKMGFVEKAKMIVFDPKGFFNIMPQSGGYKDPLTFYAIIIAISALLSSSLELIFSVLQSAEAMFSGIIGLLISPVVVVLLGTLILFVTALLNHILIKIAGGKGNYEQTLRVMAYSSVPSLFSWLPLVGILALIYQIYITITGYSKVHNISALRILIALLLPGIILAAIILLLLYGVLISTPTPLSNIETPTASVLLSSLTSLLSI